MTWLPTLHDHTPGHASAWAPARGWMPAPMVGSLYVSAAEKNELDKAIITMTAEVNTIADLARKQNTPDAVALTKFQGERWTPFVMEWNAWFKAEAGTIVTVDTGKFTALKTKFNQLRQEWITQLGKVTATAPIEQDKGDVIDEIEKGLQESGKTIGKGIGFGLAGLGGLLTAALVIAGVVYLGPVVAPLLKRRGK